jgi:two-component system chemotaxis sensor kinase CheA
MSDFAGMEELLEDFLVEAGDLLSGVDNKLVDLERAPNDRSLLNEIFRGFHTIKGGAGFLNATELVTLCHLTENLFDNLRNGQLDVTSEIMDVILEATGVVRDMFGSLEHTTQPAPADPSLIARLRAAIAGELGSGAAAEAPPAASVAAASPQVGGQEPAGSPNWESLYSAVTGVVVSMAAAPASSSTSTGQVQVVVPAKAPEEVIQAAVGRRAGDKPGASAPTGRRDPEKSPSPCTAAPASGPA